MYQYPEKAISQVNIYKQIFCYRSMYTTRAQRRLNRDQVDTKGQRVILNGCQIIEDGSGYDGTRTLMSGVGEINRRTINTKREYTLPTSERQ